MKHEDIYYTCDRCGKRIERTPYEFCGIPFMSKMKKSELTVAQAEKKGYISAEQTNLPDIDSVDIVEYYDKKTKTYHLCNDCRKEFERFLNGKAVIALERG